MTPKVIVVGSFVQDLTWKCADFPRPGETIVGAFVTGPGGKGSNQAIAAGRTGVQTLFIGAVGADAFAEAAKQFYKTNRIAAQFATKPKHATGTAAILVSEKGENEIIVALGANAFLAKSDIDPQLLAQAEVVVTQAESNLVTAAYVLKTARRAGTTTIFNPAPMRSDFDAAILRYVDVLIPNETEFTALVNRLPACGRSNFLEAELEQLSHEELHSLCRTMDIPTVIVTLGSRGCFVSEAQRFRFIPSHRVEAVDTTGAGDAFVGGFAAGLVRSKGDITAAAEFGTLVAALSVTKFGTAPSMPTEKEIDQFLKKRSRKTGS